jgi:hypothetical protein
MTPDHASTFELADEDLVDVNGGRNQSLADQAKQRLKELDRRRPAAVLTKVAPPKRPTASSGPIGRPLLEDMEVDGATDAGD